MQCKLILWDIPTFREQALALIDFNECNGDTTSAKNNRIAFSYRS
jgi:hypothetical protein